MNARNYPTLAQFLGGYFHQDWPDEFADPDEAVGVFLRGEPDEAVRATCRELDQVIRDIRQGSNPGEFLADFGCYYDPQADQQSVLEWLTHVHDQLMRKQSSARPVSG